MQYGSPGATGVTFDRRVTPPAAAAKMKVGIDFIVGSQHDQCAR